MRTGRASHAQGEQLTQGHVWDDVCAIIEQTRVKTGLPNDRIETMPQSRRVGQSPW
jgi:hypothetical protein